MSYLQLPANLQAHVLARINKYSNGREPQAAYDTMLYILADRLKVARIRAWAKERSLTLSPAHMVGTYFDVQSPVLNRTVGMIGFGTPNPHVVDIHSNCYDSNTWGNFTADWKCLSERWSIFPLPPSSIHQDLCSNVAGYVKEFLAL